MSFSSMLLEKQVLAGGLPVGSIGSHLRGCMRRQRSQACSGRNLPPMHATPGPAQHPQLLASIKFTRAAVKFSMLRLHRALTHTSVHVNTLYCSMRLESGNAM